jgi:hypothetical protein
MQRLRYELEARSVKPDERILALQDEVAGLKLIAGEFFFVLLTSAPLPFPNYFWGKGNRREPKKGNRREADRYQMTMKDIFENHPVK